MMRKFFLVYSLLVMSVFSYAQYRGWSLFSDNHSGPHSGLGSRGSGSGYSHK